MHPNQWKSLVGSQLRTNIGCGFRCFTDPPHERKRAVKVYLTGVVGIIGRFPLKLCQVFAVCSGEF